MLVQWEQIISTRRATDSHSSERELIFKLFRHAKNKSHNNSSEEGAAEIEAPEIDPNSPYAYNQRLFDKLCRDLEAGTLPEIRKPSEREIAACGEQRRKDLENVKLFYSAEDLHEEWGGLYSLKRIRANQEIPVEVELWVDTVCDRYLGKAKPMMGLVHWENGARKQLYESRGYTWHSNQDIYQLARFD